MGGVWKEEKVRPLKRFSFRYLTGARNKVLFDIVFDVDNQDDIVTTLEKLSDLMRERNIELSINCKKEFLTMIS